MAEDTLKTEYEYIRFERVFEKKPKKTGTWIIYNKRSGSVLGFIKWHGAWRQYCKFDIDGVVFNKDCLLDVIDFLRQLKLQRQRSKSCQSNSSEHS